MSNDRQVTPSQLQQADAGASGVLAPGAVAPPSAPPAGSPPAVPPAAAGGTPAPGGSGTPPAEPGYLKWDPDLHEIGKKYAGSPDPHLETAKALRNAEKLIGGDPKLLLKIPAEGDSEAQATLWNKLGRPEKPDGYKLPEALAKDETLGKMLPEFHKMGLTQAQVAALTEMSAAQAKAINEAADASYAAQAKSDIAALRVEWGQAFERNDAAAMAAIQKLGLTDKQVTALARAEGSSVAIVLKQLAAAGATLLEAKAAGGPAAPGSGMGAMTPQEAAAKWTSLTKDREFVAKLQRKDPAAMNIKRELDAARRGISGDEFTRGLSGMGN